MLLPSNYRHCQGGSLPGKERAFTLVELLVVVGIMSLLMMLALPAFNAISGAGSLTKGASDLQGFLEQARSLAMSQNTYVYVGVQEVDVMTGSTNSATPYGRVVVAAASSLNGTRAYTNGPNSPGILSSTNVTQLSKALYFDNVHIASANSTSPNMTNRPSATVNLSTNTTTQTTFTWPIGATASKYSFLRVIEFDPQGVPRVQLTTTYSPSIQNYIEIPLVMTHGNQTNANSLNQAAIQLDGITGAVIVYRP